MSIRNLHVHNHLTTATSLVATMGPNSIGTGEGVRTLGVSETDDLWPWTLPNIPVSDVAGKATLTIGDRYFAYRNNMSAASYTNFSSTNVFSLGHIVHTMPGMANTPHVPIMVDGTTYIISLFKVSRGKFVIMVAISCRESTSTTADPILGFDRVWGVIKEYPAFMRRELKLDHTPALFAFFVSLPLVSRYHAMYSHIREFAIHAQPYQYVSILNGLFVAGTAVYFKANDVPLDYTVNTMRGLSIIEFSTELTPLTHAESSPFRRSFPPSISTDTLILTDTTGATAVVPLLDISAALAAGQTTVKYSGKTYLL